MKHSSLQLVTGEWTKAALGAIALFLLLASFIGASFFINPTSVGAVTELITNGDFGIGDDQNDIPSWEERGNENSDTTIAKNPTSGNESVSPNGGRFAKIGRFNSGASGNGFICQEIDATNFEDLVLSFYWRGDIDAESGGSGADFGYVEYLTNGSCETADNQWTNLKTYNDITDGGWISDSADLSALDGDTFFIRFRAHTTSDIEHWRVDGISLLGNEVVQGEHTNATIVVDTNNHNGWLFVDDADNSVLPDDYVFGPGTAPLGDGSARLIAAVSSDKDMLIMGHGALSLIDIVTLTYKTYQTITSGAPAIALQFNIDDDITDADNSWKGRLVYEPYYTHTVQTGVWQEWDTQDNSVSSGNGNWWLSNGTLASNTGCSISTPCTWDEILTALPNGGIHPTLGAVLFKAGSGWTGFDGNVDEFVFGTKSGADTHTITYDFEPGPSDDTPPQIFVKDDTEEHYVGNLGTKTFSYVSFKLHDNEAIDYFTINGHHFEQTDGPWSDANFGAISPYFILNVVDGNTLELFDTSGNSATYTFTFVAPQQCSVTIVSDTTNTVTEKGGAYAQALSFIHNAWTAVISGASWIWGDNPVATPTTVAETQTFVKTFEWSGPIDSALLNIAADNYYTVKVNNVEVASEQLIENNFQVGTQDGPIDVSANLVEGVNTLEIVVTNKALANSSPTNNPAGLKYSLIIVSTETGNDCMSAPQATLCPLVPSPNGILVDFGTNQLIRTDQTITEATLGPVAVNIPAGYYDVTLASYDDHSGHGGQGQQYEQWHAILKDVSLDTVTQTSAIGDLPEDDDWKTEQVDTALFVASDVTSVTAFHDAYYSDGVESIYPSCAVFEPVDAPAQCVIGQELLVNGDFETPVVSASQNWDTFPSGTLGLGWVVEWFGGNVTFNSQNRPTLANLELQKHGLSGWNAVGGAGQWTELDSDWFGPTNPLNGEPGSVAISQTILTEIGGTYSFSFDFSPRPNTAQGQNKVEFLVNDVLQGTVGPTAGGSNTAWTSHEFSFVADTLITKVTLRDAGTPNDSLGTFVDNASLMCTAPVVVEPELATVTLCKVDEQEQPLSGWTLSLLGDHVETVDVPSNGVEVFSANALDGLFAFFANGTYVYRPNTTGSTTDAAFSKRSETGDPIPPSGPYAPWVLVNNLPSPYQGYLGITVDGALGTTNWGSVFNPLHEYALQYTGDGDAAGFKMVDSAYGDNSGSLTVDIYEGYTGVTGGNGCVVFTDVPYGTYTASEIQQEGWTQIDGPTNPVIVDSASETFTFVNALLAPEESIITLPENDYDSYEQGPVPLAAFYADENGDGNDGVQWAVRYGSCNAGTNTVFGNVDGHSDSFVWDHTNFSATFDASSATPGNYCFIFNPTEDSGDANQRLTRWFTIEAPVLGAPTLTIVKNSGGWIGDFEWLITTISEFSQSVSTTTNGDGFATTTITLGEGSATYTVAEVLGESWTFVDASCTFENGDPVVSGSSENGYYFTAVNGDDVICHFNNVTSCGESEYYDETTKQCEPNNGYAHFDLSIAKGVDHDGTPSVGEPATYTITVANAGPSVAQNITVEDNLPVGVSWIGHDTSNDNDAAYDPNTGVWTISALGVGVSVTLDIAVEIGEAGVISNTASITGYDSNGNDTSSGNNSATVEFTAGAAENGGGGEVSSLFSVGGGGPLNFTPAPQVLGASTTGDEVLGESCGLYLDQHVRRGYAGNDTNQVIKLQTFLNKHGFGSLIVDGVFGETTENAVKAFQQTYANDILAPWGITEPTGLVYLTTLRQINLIECPHLSILIPALIAWGGDSSENNFSQIANKEESNDEETTNDTEGDEPETPSDNSDQSAGAGNAVKNQGFWSKLWGILFGN